MVEKLGLREVKWAEGPGRPRVELVMGLDMAVVVGWELEVELWLEEAVELEVAREQAVVVGWELELKL